MTLPRPALHGAVLYPGTAPRPYNEREAWERELREELPPQLAGYQQELAAGQADETRRDFLEGHSRRVRKRTAELEARLAKAVDGSQG